MAQHTPHLQDSHSKSPDRWHGTTPGWRSTYALLVRLTACTPQSPTQIRLTVCTPQSPTQIRLTVCTPQSPTQIRLTVCIPQSLTQIRLTVCTPQSPTQIRLTVCTPQSPTQIRLTVCTPQSPTQIRLTVCTPQSPTQISTVYTAQHNIWDYQIIIKHILTVTQPVCISVIAGMDSACFLISVIAFALKCIHVQLPFFWWGTSVDTICTRWLS